MKTGKKIVSFLLIFFFLCFLLISGGYLYLKQNAVTVTFSSQLTKEGSMHLKNPYQGFYQLYGLTLTNDDISKAEELAARIAKDENHVLALLEINLKNFRDEPLSGAALTQLDRVFSLCSETSHQFIVRFLYDWDGKALETEPDSIELIETHMEQVAHYVNQYKEHIYLLQGIFLGDCGEMHHSKHMEAESMTRLLKKLADATDESIYLSVRTPAHWRIINNRTVPLTEEEGFSSGIASRLGLFNDGMMGSDIDLGTYGTSSFVDSTNPADKGTREEELEFQNRLCRFVPNGGECVLDNSFNDFENAITDLKKMNVSYLNSGHDMAVISKWKNSVFQSTDSSEKVFDGMNGFDYIKAHLGYRYVLENAALDYAAHLFHPSASLSLSIKNTGFSPAYKKFTSALLIQNSETGAVTETEIPFDNRGLNSDETAEISIPLDLNDFEEGMYRIYLRMQDKTTGLPIRFANEGLAEQGTSATQNISAVQNASAVQTAPSNPDTLADNCIFLGEITVS